MLPGAARCSQMLQGVARYSQMLQDAPTDSQILPDTPRCSKILPDAHKQASKHIFLLFWILLGVVLERSSSFERRSGSFLASFWSVFGVVLDPDGPKKRFCVHPVSLGGAGRPNCTRTDQTRASMLQILRANVASAGRCANSISGPERIAHPKVETLDPLSSYS